MLSPDQRHNSSSKYKGCEVPAGAMYRGRSSLQRISKLRKLRALRSLAGQLVSNPSMNDQRPKSGLALRHAHAGRRRPATAIISIHSVLIEISFAESSRFGMQPTDSWRAAEYETGRPAGSYAENTGGVPRNTVTRPVLEPADCPGTRRIAEATDWHEKHRTTIGRRSTRSSSGMIRRRSRRHWRCRDTTLIPRDSDITTPPASSAWPS